MLEAAIGEGRFPFLLSMPASDQGVGAASTNVGLGVKALVLQPFGIPNPDNLAWLKRVPKPNANQPDWRGR